MSPILGALEPMVGADEQPWPETKGFQREVQEKRKLAEAGAVPEDMKRRRRTGWSRAGSGANDPRGWLLFMTEEDVDSGMPVCVAVVNHVLAAEFQSWISQRAAAGPVWPRSTSRTTTACAACVGLLWGEGGMFWKGGGPRRRLGWRFGWMRGRVMSVHLQSVRAPDPAARGEPLSPWTNP